MEDESEGEKLVLGLLSLAFFGSKESGKKETVRKAHAGQIPDACSLKVQSPLRYEYKLF